MLGQLGIEQVHLVLHDFGGPWGLAWATAHPTSVRSLALFNVGVPLGYQWHRTARLVRTPLLGELLMALTTRKSFEGVLRRGGGSLPPGFVDRAWANFTPPTRRAAMKAYRAIPNPAQLGTSQAAVLTAYRLPALVFWGELDGFSPVEIAERQREVFDPIELVRLAGRATVYLQARTHYGIVEPATLDPLLAVWRAVLGDDDLRALDDLYAKVVWIPDGELDRLDRLTRTERPRSKWSQAPSGL